MPVSSGRSVIMMIEKNANATVAGALPWYRYYYVWLLIAIPAVAVVGGIATLIVAASTFDGLVVDDYYKRGLEINRTFERDHSASNKALTAALLINEGSQHFRVELKGNDQFQEPEQIQVSFLNATRGGMDQTRSMKLLGSGIYEGDMPKLPPGIWNVMIEAQDWRLLERWHNN